MKKYTEKVPEDLDIEVRPSSDHGVSYHCYDVEAKKYPCSICMSAPGRRLPRWAMGLRLQLLRVKKS